MARAPQRGYMNKTIEVDAEGSLVAAKLLPCFDELGFNVTVAAAQDRPETARAAKVRRMDAPLREFRVWSSLLCRWSPVFEAMPDTWQ